MHNLCPVPSLGFATDQRSRHTTMILSSAVPELWFSSSGGVCVCVRVCREPLYL